MKTIHLFLLAWKSSDCRYFWRRTFLRFVDHFEPMRRRRRHWRHCRRRRRRRKSGHRWRFLHQIFGRFVRKRLVKKVRMPKHGWHGSFELSHRIFEPFFRRFVIFGQILSVPRLRRRFLVWRFGARKVSDHFSVEIFVRTRFREIFWSTSLRKKTWNEISNWNRTLKD